MKSLFSLLLLALSAGPASAGQETHSLPRPDGSLIHYSLDTPTGESAGLLVLAQGSGCQPGAGSANLAIVRAAFPAHTALIVEKSGITPNSAIVDGLTDCPADFIATFTLSQRIEDYERVLAHLRPDSMDDVILFGGSEGGLAMEALAARIRPAAAILLSGSVGGTFEDMVLSTVPAEGKTIVAAGFAEARANPDSTLFSGHTNRFWADSLDHRSSDYLDSSDTPFLLIYGGRDPAAGQNGRVLADRFAAAGRCNLSYWEFPALDHGMADPAGSSRMGDIARLAATWAEKPLGAC